MMPERHDERVLQHGEMGRRGHKRLRIELPVTVSGLDANGNLFTQSATTVDISARGLCVRYISCLRGQCGQPVQVKYKRQSARYLVAWIGDDGTPLQGLIGLQGLDANYLFADHLPPDFAFASSDPGADGYVVPGTDGSVVPGNAFNASPGVAERCKDGRQVERRRYPRFHCSGTAHVWEQGQELAFDARVNEIALGGCYVEIMSPLRVATCVRLELSIKSRSFSVEGIVVYAQPQFGMGIEFMKIAPAEAEKLHRLIGELSGAVPTAAPAPPVSASSSPPGSRLEEALNQWFGAHDVLTRQEFRKLAEESAHATHDLTHAS